MRFVIADIGCVCQYTFKSTFEDIEKIVYRYIDSHIMDKDGLLKLLEKDHIKLEEDK